MGVITLLVFALVAILSYTQISSQGRILEMELNERIALMRANLVGAHLDKVGEKM